MDRSDSRENSPPVIGAPDMEKPEATKARRHAWHKERSTLGVCDALYGKNTTEEP